MHYSLLYISRIARPATVGALDAIREQAIAQNQTRGVTGLLLWSREYFCQILQGEKLAVEETIRRIECDERHCELVILMRSELDEILFPDWSMATSHIDDAAIASLIARAHTSQPYEAGLIDEIIRLMQQFQLQDQSHARSINSSVQFRSDLDKKLEVLARNDASDESLEQILKLGAVIFPGCSLGLLLNSPGSAECTLKAFVGNNAQINANLLTGFKPRSVFSNAKKPVGVNKRVDKNIQRMRLDEQASNTIAAVCEICVSPDLYPALNSPQNSRQNLGENTVHPRATDVVGYLLVLFRDNAVDDLLPSKNLEKNTALMQLATCIESQLQEKIRFHAGELLKLTQQRSLTVSGRRQELVMNIASSAIVALDADCRVLLINQAARQMFGLTTEPVPFHWPKSVKFIDPSTLVPVSQSPVVLASINAAKQQSDSFKAITGDLFALQVSDSQPLRYLKTTITETRDQQSAISCVIVFDDVTELQHNRERVRRGDRLEALGHLTGGVAHDFNNLLSTIQSAVELSKMESNKKPRHALLDIAIDSVQRGTDLTDRLVGFATARPVDPKPHYLKDIMSSVADLASTSIAQDIHFSVKDFPQSLAVVCDAGQLQNALLNVLINSRDAIIESGVGGSVSVSVATTKSGSVDDLEQADRVSIVITDNGPGMSAEVIRLATDPFFTTRSESTGSGLGLSMVYRFTEQSHGELLIENVSDTQAQSTGVRITLLLKQAKNSLPHALRNKTAVLPSGTLVPKQHSRATVLVVEDNPDLAELLQQLIQKIGVNTRLASNAESALRVLQDDIVVNLLLTDIVMQESELDGYALAARAVEINPDLKVVYLSGYAHQSKKSPAVLYGPLIKKPVSLQKLADVIQQELGLLSAGDAIQLPQPEDM